MPQGTIRSFDHETRSGSLLDDGLRELHYDAEAFRAAGLMELRIGQRVRFQLEGSEDEPTVTHLNLVSL
jgi:cold shock CspA family protein